MSSTTVRRPRRLGAWLLPAALYTLALAAGWFLLATQSAFVRGRWLHWASTNLANLHHHPLAALGVSAVLVPGSVVGWLLFAFAGLAAGGRSLGTWGVTLVAGIAHIGGTLISQTIVAVRIATGALGQQARYVTDVGPSYVVVSVLAAALVAGHRWVRVIGGVGLLLLAPFLFDGLLDWDVAAVGHVCSILIGASLGWLIAHRRGAVDAALTQGPAAT